MEVEVVALGGRGGGSVVEVEVVELAMVMKVVDWWKRWRWWRWKRWRWWRWKRWRWRRWRAEGDRLVEVMEVGEENA